LAAGGKALLVVSGGVASDASETEDRHPYKRPAQVERSMLTSPDVRNAEKIVTDLTLLGTDPMRSASAVGLCYVTPPFPCIRRVRVGKGFRYVAECGRPIVDGQDLQRIRALAIPPAWTDVQICTRSDGHIQATGRDAKGRKQYRYHVRWRRVRDETKFGRMIAFAEALPAIRARVSKDSKRPGLPREKVVAVVVQLLERTLIRVGNEEYAKQNRSYGLTTMRVKHVNVRGPKISFQFRGKSGIDHVVDVCDRRLARVIRRCQELPGQELFRYVDQAGVVRTIESADVNAYLREAAGSDFSAKDFRTWYGSLLAARALLALRRGAAPHQKHVKTAIAQVAEKLGNTPAVCRKSYVHPAVVDCYVRGDLKPPGRAVTANRGAPGRQDGRLDAEERTLLAILKTELARQSASIEESLRLSVHRARARANAAVASKGARRKAA
jgi:DNA topoisomerase-1